MLQSSNWPGAQLNVALLTLQSVYSKVETPLSCNRPKIPLVVNSSFKANVVPAAASPKIRGNQLTKSATVGFQLNAPSTVYVPSRVLMEWCERVPRMPSVSRMLSLRATVNDLNS